MYFRIFIRCMNPIERTWEILAGVVFLMLIGVVFWYFGDWVTTHFLFVAAL